MSNQSIQPVKPSHQTGLKTGVKTNVSVNPEAWSPCQPGVLVASQAPFMFERLSRRMALFQMVVIYSMGFLTVYASFLAFTGQSAAEPKLPPDLSCDVIQSLLADYADQTLSNPRVRESVAFHLAHCARCDREHQSLIGEEVDLVRRKNFLQGDDCHVCADGGYGSCQSHRCDIHSCNSGDTADFQLDGVNELGISKSEFGSKSPASCKKQKKDHNELVEPCIVP